MPSVSVVVPVYNTEAYLRECLDSIVSQTHRDIEIVCVNDGSTDGSAAILQQYAAKDDRIRIVAQENRGLPGARNSGLDVVRGDYVLFLDSDDHFEPTMIEGLYSRCLEDDAEIAVSRIRYVYADSGISLDASWSLRTDVLPSFTPFSRSDLTSNVFLAFSSAVWNKMFKRSYLLGHGIRFHPDLLRAEDVPFTWTALAGARRITIVDESFVNYRTGRPHSLQSTIHERPLEICRALSLAKNDMIALGVFAEVEQDFVNAALRECLFTLETVKTLDAYRELFAALRDRYLVELGIAGRDRDYFTSEQEYEWYLTLMRLSPEEFLIEHRNSLETELTTTRTHSAWTRAQLVNHKDELQKTLDKLATVDARLAAAEGRLARIQGSSAYRVGRAVTYIPRRLKRVFRRGPKSE